MRNSFRLPTSSHHHRILILWTITKMTSTAGTSLKVGYVLKTVYEHIARETGHLPPRMRNLALAPKTQIVNGRLSSTLGRRSYSISRSFSITSRASSSANASPVLAPAATNTPIPTPAQPITAADLPRLHRLSALNPPLSGSQDEVRLLDGLNELVSLMEGVRQVELPEFSSKEERDEWVRELLSEGIQEVVIGEFEDGPVDKEARSEVAEQEHYKDVTHEEQTAKSGRDLLEYATRRAGDYYASKTKPRST